MVNSINLPQQISLFLAKYSDLRYDVQVHMHVCQSSAVVLMLLLPSCFVITTNKSSIESKKNGIITFKVYK